MKHSKSILQKGFGLVALLAAMFLVNPSFSNSSDCDLMTGNYLICYQDFDDTVAAIKEACDGIVPPGVTIKTVNCVIPE
jgi:hypothetical protein